MNNYISGQNLHTGHGTGTAPHGVPGLLFCMDSALQHQRVCWKESLERNKEDVAAYTASRVSLNAPLLGPDTMEAFLVVEVNTCNEEIPCTPITHVTNGAAKKNLSQLLRTVSCMSEGGSLHG